LTDLARFPAAWFVKYETVIGIMGNTQGVKSDKAPSVIASQINGQISVGCLGAPAVGGRLEGVGTVDADVRAPRLKSSDPEKDTRVVLGGKQKVSLQSWYRTSKAKPDAGPELSARTGTWNTALLTKYRVSSGLSLTRKFGSGLITAFGEIIGPERANGFPSVILIVVAIGPPSGCSRAYKCHPGSIAAAKLAFIVSPVERDLSLSADVRVHLAGVCAQRDTAKVAMTMIRLMRGRCIGVDQRYTELYHFRFF
jgi:hypothetical protein